MAIGQCNPRSLKILDGKESSNYRMTDRPFCPASLLPCYPLTPSNECAFSNFLLSTHFVKDLGSARWRTL